MVAGYKACSFKKNARKGIVSKSEKAYRSVYQSLYYVSANCSDRRIYIDTFIGIDISKSQFDNFISIHTKQLVLGLTAFFIPKFQIGVMKWCLLELFNKIIGA